VAKSDILDRVYKLALFIVKADVDALRPINLVGVFAWCLPKLERGYFAFSLLELCYNLVAAFGLNPVSRPSYHVLLDCGITLVNSGLDSVDEVWQSRVTPFMILEVDLESVGKSVPAN
jgi:hypothetical protein